MTKPTAVEKRRAKRQAEETIKARFYGRPERRFYDFTINGGDIGSDYYSAPVRVRVGGSGYITISEEI